MNTVQVVNKERRLEVNQGRNTVKVLPGGRSVEICENNTKASVVLPGGSINVFQQQGGFVVVPEKEVFVVSVAVQGPRGIPGESGSGSVGANLEAMVHPDYPGSVKGMVYGISGIESIIVWNDATKSLKLFTKNVLYTSGRVTGLEYINELTSERLIKTISYDVNGNVESIIKEMV